MSISQAEPAFVNVDPAEACCLCNSWHATVIQQGVREDPSVKAVRCLCGLVYLSPMPTEDDLKAFYATSYRTQAPAETYRKGIFPARERVLRMSQHLSADMELLDIGCSSGSFLDAVRLFVRTASGIEADSQCQKWCRYELDYRVHSSLIPLWGCQFGIITMFHTLEHLPNPVEYLRELKKHLKPGGKLFIEVPNVEDVLVSTYQANVLRW